MKRLCDQDLVHVLDHTKELWYNAANKTFFLTGGTGFFGKWLTESFIYINERLKLNARLIILSRNPEAHLKKFPFYRNQEGIQFITGDITTFEFPEEEIDFIIHAATEASATLNVEQPLLMYDTIVDGTRRILELAKAKKVKAILNTSSGAVYGKQPHYITHVAEEFIGNSDLCISGAAYGEGKRVSEMLCHIYNNKYGVSCKIARCFAFVGPYLPLDAHFAVGNFINDLLQRRDIHIQGDGTPYRSYLYASDLAVWLWTILFSGQCCRPYNVGSDEDLTIHDLANKIASFDKNVSVFSKAKDVQRDPNRYVPSIYRAKKELGLEVTIDLNKALTKTIEYYKQNEKSKRYNC